MARLSNKVHSKHLILVEGVPRDKKKSWHCKYYCQWRCRGHITAYNPVHIVGLSLYRTQYERNHSFQKMNESQTNVFSVDVNLFLIFLRRPHSINWSILYFSDTFVHWFFSIRIDSSEFFCDNKKIKNGVKQGDALSCTLFILSMEPLIRNIEANQDIRALQSRAHNITFPKCIGYADDINIITANSVVAVRATIT